MSFSVNNQNPESTGVHSGPAAANSEASLEGRKVNKINVKVDTGKIALVALGIVAISLTTLLICSLFVMPVAPIVTVGLAMGTIISVLLFGARFMDYNKL